MTLIVKAKPMLILGSEYPRLYRRWTQIILRHYGTRTRLTATQLERWEDPIALQSKSSTSFGGTLWDNCTCCFRGL